MEETELKVNSIFDGNQPAQYFGTEGSFLSSIAIDPDYPISSSGVKASGFAVPIGYADFTSTNLNSTPVAIINTPKTTLTYVILANGKLLSYDSALTNEALLGTVAGGAASGGFYYNNYVYILTPTDVSRWGPLNGVAALTDNVWTGATLGSLTALTNTTYPTLRSVSLPNHWGHVHGNNCAYFTDFVNGQGLIHMISTKKVTAEGDTNGTTVPSAYNVLDLPIGFYPTDIASANTNLLIIGISGTDTTINQGQASYVLWDPTDTVSFFFGPEPLPDVMATAAYNKDGTIFIFTGNTQSGTRVSEFAGNSVKPLLTLEDSLPPFPGAVDAVGERVVWGGFTTNPNANACVYAWGSKDPRLPTGLHNILKTSSAGSNPIVTALKHVLQSSYKQPQFAVGWHDGSDNGIDKYSSSATLASNIRFMFNIGKKFQITSIRIPLAGAVDSNTTITPKVYLDDLSSSKTLTVINNTNNPSARKAIYKGAELKDYEGENNFVLEINWTGTTPLPVALPIRIKVEIKEDEK
jgi:hypothetical protein